MSHDRGCFRCGEDPPYDDCKDPDCPKRDKPIWDKIADIREKHMKLLPCPFCGGEAEITRYGDRRQSTQYTCTFCGCFLETGEEWDHGNRWNKRSDETDKKVIEALHKIIDAYAEDEGYVPLRVLDLWNEYHREWDVENHIGQYRQGTRKV